MLRHMEPPDFQVIVVRAWRDTGGLRVRLLTDGDSERQWVVHSIADACAVLGSVLAELAVAPSALPPRVPDSG